MLAPQRSVPDFSNGLPDALGRDLPVRKLRHRLDARQAVPDFHQPLVVGADQVGELHFVGKDSSAGIAGGLPGSVDGDVVFCVDRKVFHLRVISWRGNDRGDHIHHSGREHMQVNSAGGAKRRDVGCVAAVSALLTLNL